MTRDEIEEWIDKQFFKEFISTYHDEWRLVHAKPEFSLIMWYDGLGRNPKPGTPNYIPDRRQLAVSLVIEENTTEELLKYKWNNCVTTLRKALEDRHEWT